MELGINIRVDGELVMNMKLSFCDFVLVLCGSVNNQKFLGVFFDLHTSNFVEGNKYYVLCCLFYNGLLQVHFLQFCNGFIHNALCGMCNIHSKGWQ
jgi:hypothetical protein